MDGDYLKGRGVDVEICEPGILQVVKVSFSQSIPEAKRKELMKSNRILM